MMKKYFLTLAAVLCCAMTTTVFTACGGDDDDDKTPANDNKPVAVAMNLTCEFTQDMLDNCTIEMKYSDDSGEKSEIINSLTWTKQLSAKLPTTLKVSRTVTVKGGVDLSTMTSFSYKKGLFATIKISNAAGKELTASTTGNTSSGTGKGANVGELIQNGKLNEEHVYTFNANGILQ